MKLLLIVLLCFLLSGCSLFKYIPSKILVDNKSETLSSNTYNYYLKFLNGANQKVYKINDDYALASIFINDISEKEVFYELDENININKVMAMLRSFYNAKLRIYFGSTSDFGMLRVEYENKANEDKALIMVKKIISELIKNEMSNEERIKIVHDYIISNTIYDSIPSLDEAEQSSSFSSYGLLFNNKAVCEGYSKSFLLFMKELQIPCLTIESQIMNHAFNYVYVNDSWKFIDLTFDDPIPDHGKIYYTYYLQDYATFTKDKIHSFDELASNGLSFEEYENFVENINWDQIMN